MWTQPSIAQAFRSLFVNFGWNQIGLAWIYAHDHLGKVSWHGMLRCQAGRPGQFWLIFGALVHPKLVALVRNKQNMHGTWFKAQVICNTLI